MAGFCTRISQDSQRIGTVAAVLHNVIDSSTTTTKAICASALSVIAGSALYALAKKCLPGKVQLLMPDSFLKKIPLIVAAGAGVTLIFAYLVQRPIQHLEKSYQQRLHDSIMQDMKTVCAEKTSGEMHQALVPLIEEFFTLPEQNKSKEILDLLATLNYSHKGFEELFSYLLGYFSGNRLPFLNELTNRFVDDSEFAQKGEMKNGKKDYTFIRAYLQIIKPYVEGAAFQALPDEAARYVRRAHNDSWAVFQSLPRS